VSDSFGRRLRQERERREILLTTVAATTKISLPLLEGLERDDLSRWPLGIFRRSFLRAYAGALGLDVEPLMREFLTRFPDPHERQPTTECVETSHPIEAPALRLTLAESWWPFAGGRRLVHVRRRWMAAAWDVAVLTGVAASAFAIHGRFWLPFGIASLVYYAGGIVVLGNSPGVCLFGPIPKPHDVATSVATLEQADDQELSTPQQNPLRLVHRA
jgi:hypothetical protein